ncbi:hypothetical protein ACH3XW_37005 [Acanthocheilonema viteae]
MFLYRLSFFMVLLGDYVYTGNIYLNNQCSHFLGKIFICKRATDDKLCPRYQSKETKQLRRADISFTKSMDFIIDSKFSIAMDKSKRALIQR